MNATKELEIRLTNFSVKVTEFKKPETDKVVKYVRLDMAIAALKELEQKTPIPSPESVSKHTRGRLIMDKRDNKIFIEAIGEDGEESYAVTICQLYGNEKIDEADAQRIVTCVNAHDDLLEALKNCIPRMDRAREILRRDGGNWGMLDTSKAKAAIAKATKQ